MSRALLGTLREGLKKDGNNRLVEVCTKWQILKSGVSGGSTGSSRLVYVNIKSISNQCVGKNLKVIGSNSVLFTYQTYSIRQTFKL